jgi:hypothetical protein
MNDRREEHRPRQAGDRRPNRDEERPGPAYAQALLAELPEKIRGVREIAAALRLDVREVGADGFEGALIRARDIPLGVIVLRETIREAGRKNFTIAHEIGHFVLPGHDHASVACTASDVGNWESSSGGRKFEREADEFAAELLMPAQLVEILSRGASPSLEVVEKIAREFGASLSAAAWRYCDLAAKNCAIVWSTEGAIRWVKRAPGFPFFLPKGLPVAEGTFAAACFAGEKVPSRPRTVPAHLWTSSTNAGSSFRMLEQSKALPSYRSVISLLWVEERR